MIYYQRRLAEILKSVILRMDMFSGFTFNLHDSLFEHNLPFRSSGIAAKNANS